MTENEIKRFEKTTVEIAEIMADACPDRYERDGNRNLYRYAKNLANACYRKIPDGAVMLLLADEKSKQAAEQFVELSKEHDLREIVFVLAQEYSDLIEAQRNYEYAKGKIEDLQKIIDKQNNQKIGLAKAYTNARRETTREILLKIYELKDSHCTSEIMELIAKEYGL